MASFTSSRGLHVERGGEGARLLVLLHGMSANAAVWRRLLPFVAARWSGRWIAPDFRGHGRSPYDGPYGYGVHAADIAALIAEVGADDVALLGHSFGGLIAALVGTGWFGVEVRRVAAVGVKIEWSEDEIARGREIARRPVRLFESRDEAVDRYLKVSGLYGLADSAAPEAQAGVRALDEKFAVAFDMRATGGVGPPVETMLKLCAAPLRLAAGSKDTMVSFEAMRRVDPAAAMIEGAGHNAHYEAPEAVWHFFEEGEGR